MDAKARIIQLIDDKQQEFIECSDAIWGYAETRFATRQSADAHIRVLENEGFQVVRGVAHMDNAFVATYGTGKPEIGILAEYDALANLSQVADLPEKKYLVDHGSGHGCGHNLLGAGTLAGAVGIKSYMEECGLRGTIKYFGCPAEESGYGKSFMAKFGVFDGIDAALTWHPSDASLLWSDGSLAVAQMYFNFKGRAAHAAAAPEMGRSALDAAELMNMGVQFLREHIIDSARIHYAFMDAGGESANVVQPSASLYYFIRAPKSDQVLDIYKRVEKIAQGAALMTETEVEIIEEKSLDNKIPVLALNELVMEQAEKVHAPCIRPARQKTGSTDFGNVMRHVPGTCIRVAFVPEGAAAHSQEYLDAGKTEAAHNAVVYGAKILALTGAQLIEDPEKLEAIKKEFHENLAKELNGQS